LEADEVDVRQCSFKTLATSRTFEALYVEIIR